ncbi:hypothetical protein LTR94_030330, partial [Friedmanniomyces endolithicus]
AGQPVLGADGQPLSTLVDANGDWSFPAALFSAGLDGFLGSVVATDPAGNSAAASVGPINGAVSTSLFLNDVTPDNVINLAESQGSVTVTGSASGAFSVGQVVTLATSNGSVYLTSLQADGSFSAQIAGADLAASNGVSASIQATDSSGAPSVVSVSHPYQIDLVGAAILVSQANGASISGTTDPGVVVTLANANGVVIASATAGANGVWSIPASAVPGGLGGLAGTLAT